MSASPTHTQSAKRPLEETSSPSNTADQPEAKRLALDKVIRSGNDDEVKALDPAPSLPANPVAAAAEANGASKTNGSASTQDVKSEGASATDGSTAANKPQPATASAPAQMPAPHVGNIHDETAWIHIRAVISSPEAATIIGKGGENVSNIRKISGAKCTVSDYQKGAVERILTVSGVVDAAAKVCAERVPSDTRWAKSE
jgi:heterogeneous nuclear rnp K-like protein